MTEEDKPLAPDQIEAHIEDVMQRRKQRQRDAAVEERRQLLVDLQAINDLEVLHGDSNIDVIAVPFQEAGVPVRIAVRTPTKNETAVYRGRMKADDADETEASIELGRFCLVYPDRETFDKMLAKRPALDSQVGYVAKQLAVGQAEREAKS